MGATIGGSVMGGCIGGGGIGGGPCSAAQPMVTTIAETSGTAVRRLFLGRFAMETMFARRRAGSKDHFLQRSSTWMSAA